MECRREVYKMARTGCDAPRSSAPIAKVHFTTDPGLKLSRQWVTQRCQGQRPSVRQPRESYLVGGRPQEERELEQVGGRTARFFVGSGKGNKRSTLQGRHFFSVASERRFTTTPAAVPIAVKFGLSTSHINTHFSWRTKDG